MFSSTVAFANEDNSDGGELTDVIIEKLDDEEIGIVNNDVGVTDQEPVISDNGEISIFGIDPPTTSHNLKNGQMNFSGSSVRSPLYTNKYFTGKSNPTIYVKNHHASASLKIRIYKKNGLTAVYSYTLKPGHSLTAVPQKVNSSSALYYIKFDAPNNFSGYVR